MNKCPSFHEAQDLLVSLAAPGTAEKITTLVNLYSNYQACIGAYEHCVRGLTEAALDYLQNPTPAIAQALVVRILAFNFGVLPSFQLGVLHPDDQAVINDAKQCVAKGIDVAIEKCLAQQEALFASVTAARAA